MRVLGTFVVSLLKELSSRIGHGFPFDQRNNTHWGLQGIQKMARDSL